MRLLGVIFYMMSISSSVMGFSLENSPKVVIVGGGIAGLTVAYRLKKAGMPVDLYEAKDRVGGRIFTVRTDGRIAELGGQNIGDGGESAHLNRLIDAFGLELSSSRVHLKHSYFDGQDLIPIEKILKEKQVDAKALKSQMDHLVATASNIKDILEKIVDPKDPLYKILSVRMAAYEGGSIDQLSPLYADTLFHMMLGGICSVHQGNPEGDNFVDLISIKGGNSLLCEKMGEHLGARVHLNMPLIEVSKDQNGLFTLTFLNGDKVTADIVVLAIPCSVYENILFGDNVIPSQKLDAIRRVQYGKNAKIMVPLTSSLLQVTGLIGDKVVAFFDTAQRILTVYYTEETSLFSSDTIADTYLKAMPMMKAGFGQDCPAFCSPVYAKSEGGLSYAGPIGYSWPNDPYAKGSYSYIASFQESILTVTEMQGEETFKTLFAPIENALYFVGEHASILFEVPGTMEAACESGERIARTILQEHTR